MRGLREVYEVVGRGSRGERVREVVGGESLLLLNKHLLPDKHQLLYHMYYSANMLYYAKNKHETEQ